VLSELLTCIDKMCLAVEFALIAVVYAVARSQYSGTELKKALRHDIDDLARNKALQVTTLPCLA